MDERLRFVARLLEGEKMAVLCREFDISRKTGYKIFARYKDCGVEGLTDRSRRPYRHANRLPFQIETLIIELKKEHPSWGAPKIREKLKRRYQDIQLPAISTVHAVLDRHGLVTRGRRSARYHAEGTGLSTPTRPNDLWCADYKGEFMLADRRYCLHDPIVTVTSCGRLCIGRRKINLSRAFAGQDVGIREVAEQIWLVTFMHYDLGFFDHETGRVECAPNPFEAQVLPMSPV